MEQLCSPCSVARSTSTGASLHKSYHRRDIANSDHSPQHILDDWVRTTSNLLGSAFGIYTQFIAHLTDLHHASSFSSPVEPLRSDLNSFAVSTLPPLTLSKPFLQDSPRFCAHFPASFAHLCFFSGAGMPCTVTTPPSDPSAATPSPPLPETYGALLVGTSFGLMLYGLTLHQYYRYVRSYRQDALWVKCLALGIVYGEVMPIYGDIALTPAFRVMETLHVVCCVAAVYYHLVSNYFNPASLSAGHWSTRVSTQVLQLSRVEQKLKQRTATTFSLIRSFSFRPRLGVSMLLCQSFYTLRLYRLGPDYTSFRLVVVVVIAMVCEFGFVLALTIEGYLLSFDDFQHVIWLICLLAGFSVFIDICLMGTLVAALMKSKTGYNRMDSLIDVLIIYSINAGVLTSVFALLTFIFAIALPGNLIYVAFSIIGVKCTSFFPHSSATYVSSALIILRGSVCKLCTRSVSATALLALPATADQCPTLCSQQLELSTVVVQPNAGGLRAQHARDRSVSIPARLAVHSYDQTTDTQGTPLLRSPGERESQR
ncbi:hypothetical protein NUW54_g450 [Trametes sanguinea]|uniref:Uncharacterized protein n=1 Tax=Trametes sanguinea TaxID=158606 RepID=A0ACC1QC65_9APHY|nr:hypothetical protein NUW54_g450 [Trametes sanguinea]